MLSEALLKRTFVTFSQARRTLYQLGLQPRNNSRTAWEDSDGLMYQIVAGDQFCKIEPVVSP